MNDNIKIPYPLFTRLINFLEIMDTYEFSPAIQQVLSDLHRDMSNKISTLELRTAYSQIIYAKNDDARHDASMKYLSLKRDLKGGCSDA